MSVREQREGVPMEWMARMGMETWEHKRRLLKILINTRSSRAYICGSEGGNNVAEDVSESVEEVRLYQ